MLISKFFKPAVVALVAATATASCATGPAITEFSNAPRTLKLEEYFNGQTTAYGVFEDRFGKIRRQFKVDITGTVNGNRLTLVENFDYSDGEKDTRIWEIDILGNGKYRGKAGDVTGMAEGAASGNAFNWKYKVDLKVGDATWNVGFDDWMYLLEDDVLINRAYVTRYGVEIGQVTISFKK
jgi:Protein of unknown function (DUF3833)